MKRALILFIIIMSGGLYSLAFAQSDEIEELSEEIVDTSGQLSEIEQKIKEDERKLNELAGQKNSLQKTITNLDYSKNKLEKDIIQTSQEIGKTDNEIKTLAQQIEGLERDIVLSEIFIREIVTEINKTQNKSFWEVFLLYPTFSEYLDRITNIETTGEVLKETLDELQDDKDNLQGKNEDKTKKKEELEELTGVLADRKVVVEITQREKEKVLVQTKNTEQIFQSALAEKIELRRQFETALLELESKLQIAIDKSLFANKSQGLFSWPVSNIRITQFFGNTSFASSGAYNGRGHSGTDFAVSIGTPVRAVMDATVISAFDTDAVGARGADGVYRSCVSYGKYVLLEHDNGLSTLYAHNSLLKVKNGDRVSRGDIIAYSGNSGYSTGPHLHFSTYATQGVQVKRLGDVSATTFYCADSVIPIISLNAYLDPYDYLPRPKFNIKTASYGQSGVREMQMMMKHERIFPIEVSANGYYGDITARSVAEWQKKYGLGSTNGKVFDQKSLDRYNLLFK